MLKEQYEEQLLSLIEEVAIGQQERLTHFGRLLIPNLTSDDLLQPSDYPLLENHPHFRYEEGVLEGIYTIRSALLAFLKEIREEQ